LQDAIESDLEIAPIWNGLAQDEFERQFEPTSAKPAGVRWDRSMVAGKCELLPRSRSTGIRYRR
jgi:hypothetical protein